MSFKLDSIQSQGTWGFSLNLSLEQCALFCTLKLETPFCLPLHATSAVVVSQFCLVPLCPLGFIQEGQKSCQINLNVCLEIFENTGDCEVLFFLPVLEAKGMCLYMGRVKPLCALSPALPLGCFTAVDLVTCSSPVSPPVLICLWPELCLCGFLLVEVFCRVFTAYTALCCSAAVPGVHQFRPFLCSPLL
ncbi:hypothetical protein EK904_014113 [Melospiza melodia maxima]|nr:hypothetical protein EK904_014113 [Melospiza melodia maxima]